jgi:AcrR family transcriptional regulator
MLTAQDIAEPGPKRRRTQQERTAAARAKLIDAAISLICEKGFSQTKTAEIASLAGLTRGAIQHHFSGRVELMTTILHEVEGRIADSFVAAAPDPNHPLGERVEILIDGLGTICRSAAYLAVADIWVTSRSDPLLREIVRASVRRSSSHFRELWQRTFGDEVSAECISECRRIVVSVIRGLVMSRFFAGDPASLGPTLATTKLLIKEHMLAGAVLRPNHNGREA